MIISKTPFRISFAGGLSDLKEYYQHGFGAVVSSTINKYIYVTVNRKFDDKIRVSYSKTEIVDTVDQIQHPIVREALKLTQLDGGIEITTIADIPSGTGLGSSSSFAVGLLNALYTYKHEHKGAEVLAREAAHIEIDLLHEPIGKQDQYAAAYGGLNHIRFNADDTVFVNPIVLKKTVKAELDKNLLLFYTGVHRQARTILSESKNNMPYLSSEVDMIRDLAEEMAASLRQNDLSRFGEILHQAWEVKKKTGKVTNPEIDHLYEKARSAGALGGKILGAGGGGFLLMYCEQERQENVRRALAPLREEEFHLEPQGSRIIYVEG
ncbi:MAG: GHMP kinase [Candidatus Thermoplasmatota archaeon]